MTEVVSTISVFQAELVESNTWGDRFWGVDHAGENWLGRVLMETRTQLREVW